MIAWSLKVSVVPLKGKPPIVTTTFSWVSITRWGVQRTWAVL